MLFPRVFSDKIIEKENIHRAAGITVNASPVGTIYWFRLFQRLRDYRFMATVLFRGNQESPYRGKLSRTKAVWMAHNSSDQQNAPYMG